MSAGPGLLAPTFNGSSQEDEACRSLGAPGLGDLHNILQLAWATQGDLISMDWREHSVEAQGGESVHLGDYVRKHQQLKGFYIMAEQGTPWGIMSLKSPT